MARNPSRVPAFLGGIHPTNKIPKAKAQIAGGKDRRARLTLSPGSSDILYKDPNNRLLEPLSGKLPGSVEGVLFPYTPMIQTSYVAEYSSITPTHTNFSYPSYGRSSVSGITVSGQWTANNPNEAKYVLAVFTFLRAATKMFYGDDGQELAGTPPPVLRFSAYGDYMFDRLPVVITALNFDLDADVDYIDVVSESIDPGFFEPGSGEVPFSRRGTSTQIPTLMMLSMTLMPVISRKRSLEFNFRDYANGGLLIGNENGRGSFP